MPPVLTKNGNELEVDLSSCRGSEFSDAKDKVAEMPSRRFDWDRKLWIVPAEPDLAERLVKGVGCEADKSIMDWIIAAGREKADELSTKLPDDVPQTLRIRWGHARAPWQPKVVNGDQVTGLLPFQRVAVDHMVRHQRVLLGDEMGLGKEQGIMTPVLTPTGWTTMGELKIGDFVVGCNGRPTEVLGVFPQGRKSLYRVTFSDGVSTLAGAEHLWAVKSPNDRSRDNAWRAVKTEELLPTKDAAGNRRWSIPLVDPVEFAPSNEILPLDPYYLGVLLGDGSFRGGTPSITCHIDDVETIERCRAVSPDEIRKLKADHEYSICGGHTRAAVKAMGLDQHYSYEKFIPELYLRASIDDRLALLQGIMDTDGYNQPKNRDGSAGCSAEITTSSPRLADGIQELVWSLGGTARRRTKKTTHRDAERITVKLPAGMNSFRLRRKAEMYGVRSKYAVGRYIEAIEFEREDEAVCILVDAADHLYVTEDYIVTHNTLIALSAVEEYRLRNGQADGPKLVIAPASVKGGWKREIERWLEPDTPLIVVDAATPAKRTAQIEEGVEANAYIICNWEQLRVKKEKRTRQVRRKDGSVSPRTETIKVPKEPLFGSTDWLAVIADEVHRAKNRESQQTQGLWLLDAQLKFGLTGTAVQNSPDELWAILAWLFPEDYHEGGQKNGHIGRMAYWPFYMTFCDHYELANGRKMVVGVKNADDLRFRLKDRMVRRTAKTLGLKGRKRIYYPVDLNPGQRKLYDEATTSMWLQVQKDAAEGDKSAQKFIDTVLAGGNVYTIPNGAARMVRQQQILESPALLGGEDDSAILDDLVEKVVDSRPDQWTVFVNYKDTCELVRGRLEKHGLTVGIYNGDVKPADRTKLEDAFQRGEIDVMVGTIGAMREGITLTAGHQQFWASRPVVPAWAEQGEARNDRKGQQEKVNVFIPQARDTVADGSIQIINDRKEKIVKNIQPMDQIPQERR